MARMKKCAWLVKEKTILIENRVCLFRQQNERNIDLIAFGTHTNARKQIFSYIFRQALKLLAIKSIDASSFVTPHHRQRCMRSKYSLDVIQVASVTSNAESNGRQNTSK